MHSWVILQTGGHTHTHTHTDTDDLYRAAQVNMHSLHSDNQSISTRKGESDIKYSCCHCTDRKHLAPGITIHHDGPQQTATDYNRQQRTTDCKGLWRTTTESNGLGLGPGASFYFQGRYGQTIIYTSSHELSVAIPDSQPMATELFQSPLYGSETVLHSISHLPRHFLSSALAWRHTSSNSVTRNHCCCARKVTLSFMDTLIALTYLLTYLLTVRIRVRVRVRVRVKIICNPLYSVMAVVICCNPLQSVAVHSHTL